MTAAPLSNSLAKVRKLLPVCVNDDHGATRLTIVDKNGNVFCHIPATGRDDALARAELIRDAMNEMR